MPSEREPPGSCKAIYRRPLAALISDRAPFRAPVLAALPQRRSWRQRAAGEVAEELGVDEEVERLLQQGEELEKELKARMEVTRASASASGSGAASSSNGTVRPEAASSSTSRKRQAESPPEEIECVLLESDDGLRFRVAGFFAQDYADETAFLFEPDGAILGLVRGVPGAPDTRVVRSAWPYHKWQRVRTGVSVGGPLLFRWNGRTFVGGRRTEDERTSTWLWELKGDASLAPILELPSAGDCSYPGTVPLVR